MSGTNAGRGQDTVGCSAKRRRLLCCRLNPASPQTQRELKKAESSKSKSSHLPLFADAPLAFRAGLCSCAVHWGYFGQQRPRSASAAWRRAVAYFSSLCFSCRALERQRTGATAFTQAAMRPFRRPRALPAHVARVVLLLSCLISYRPPLALARLCGRVPVCRSLLL